MSKSPAISSDWLSRLKEKLPDKRMGLAPADAFFTRKVDLPENLSAADKTAFIELFLEGNAPFPMEQMAWGFLEHPSSPYALVYATPKGRLKGLEIDQPEKYFQLFPGFITLFGETFEKPTVRFLSQNGDISALFLPAGNPVPERVVSRRVKAELLTDDILLESRNALEKSLRLDGYTAEPGLWLGEGSEIRANGQMLFRHRNISGSNPEGLKDHFLDLSGDTLWAADLRDPAYAAKERTARQRSILIWKSLRAAAATAILLIFFQLFILGLSAFNVLRENRIDELEPRATRVENKLTLAQRLTQSIEEDLKPFLLMEAVNPLRPDSVYFDKVRSRAYNQIQMEGESTEGVTPVNAFADSLNQLPFVESVQNNSQTRNNQTSFELVITFSSLPPAPEGGFIIPEEEEDEATDPEDTDTTDANG